MVIGKDPICRRSSACASRSYQVHLSHGPNDGVVLLADTVWPGGVNLGALGADHLFGRWLEDSYVTPVAPRGQRPSDSATRARARGRLIFVVLRR